MKAIVLHGLKEDDDFTGGDENDVTFGKLYQIMNPDDPIEDMFFIDNVGDKHYGADPYSIYLYTLYNLVEITSE